MKFIGILGMVVLLAIAYILSNNRKAIKPRIIIWGLSLQLLFAIIILAQSALSWIGMLVFAGLILLYLFADKVLQKESWGQAVAPGVVLYLAAISTVLVSYFLEKVGVSTIVFYAVLLLYLLLLILKKRAFIRYVFAVLILTALGILISRGIYGSVIFEKLAIGVGQFLEIADLGSEFLFSNLAVEEYFNGNEFWPGFGFQFAFSVLPTIIFFSAIMSILYYMGIMQAIVQMMARFMRWTMGTSGAETLSCSANVFIGQTEAPLLIKPFLDDMTLSELHAVMVGGFATIAGGVLAGYISMGVDAGHLIAASVMAAPAALVVAKIMFPDRKSTRLNSSHYS